MCKKVKTFFHVFKGSLFPQSDYYSKIPKASFRFSLKYFISLVLILNFILIILIFVKYNPGRIGRLLDGVVISLKNFPEELVINVRKGRIFTSYNRPYFLWTDFDGQKKLLLVIDETADPTKINQYRSYVLITSTEIIFKTDKLLGEKSNVISLNRLGDQTFNNKTNQKIIQNLTTIKNRLLFSYFFIIPGLMILLPISSFLITLFYLAIISLIVCIIFKVYFHKRIHYKKTLQVALHAVTFPLILDYFLIIFRPSIPVNIEVRPMLPTPLVFLILLAIYVFAAVYQAYENGNKHVVHHPNQAKTHHKHISNH